MLLVAPQAQAATRQVGIDIPVQWYADDSGQMTLDRFAALPTDQLATTRQILLWLFAKTWWLRSELPGTWFAGSRAGCSWALFCRPSDYLLPASGQRCPWHSAPLATATAPASDLHYRESVLILPAADRRRL